MSGAATAPWWRRGIIYQIYPRSFQDSNGDGIGDLPGIVRRLDHLAWLGVDAIWLSPIYPSPMADFGYDVSDYCDIDPIFGTLGDFDRLLAEAHGRGLKVILDYVPNHSSDRHPWFLEGRSSRANPKRDWYIWRDPAPGGGPPTNWLSEFGGSAWQYDAATGQYYYHAFLAAQPDLNWRNPELRAAMLDVLRFWFDRGVDGFRIDTVHHLIKDDRFQDNPPNPDFRPGMPPTARLRRLYTVDRPEVHEVLALMRRVANSYDGEGRALIGEAYLPIDRLMAYYGTGLGGVHLPFNFHLIGAPWNARVLAALIAEYEAALPPGAWPNWVLGNHDRSRIASRIGLEAAPLAAMLLLTLRGTPTMYYGDEIGLTNVPIPRALVQDPWEKGLPGYGLGRDPVRTPMPWTGEPQGGFTSGGAPPWLPLGGDVATRNVERQARDPGSLLSLYRRLIALRRAEPALSVGDISVADLGAADVLAYSRAAGGRAFLIALNLGTTPHWLAAPAGFAAARLVLSTDAGRAVEAPIGDRFELRSGEGVVLAIF